MSKKQDKDKEILSLADYKKIWSKFCFMDETGSLNSKTQDIFTIGIIKMTQPYYLQSKILYERNIKNFHDEMKFNKTSKNNIDFFKFVIGAFLDTAGTKLYTYSIYKKGEYFQKAFNDNPWTAYEELTIRLLRDAVLAPNEILILIADHVTTPRDVKFEVTVKNKINNMENRLAIAGVSRFDSRAHDLLQVVDLLIGAISYDLKIQSGEVTKVSKYKKELLDFIKENLGVTTSFIDGFRNRDANIFVDQDLKAFCEQHGKKERQKERGPSS